jgi:uncharacterized protein
MKEGRLEQTILWRCLDSPGHDACGLWALPDGWRLSGAAVFSLEEQPCHLAYTVDTDLEWRTRSATVTGWFGHEPVALAIESLAGERWSLNGTEQGAVAGCVDIDLSFTPATNLIALRRLALPIGEGAEAPAAWLDFPAPTLQRLDQQYRRLTSDRYGYRSPGNGYAGQLEVSEAGFVLRYPGLWELELVR